MAVFSEDRFREVLADRYRVEEEIGHGGMATVFRAVDLRHNRTVAIKVLDPTLANTIGVERFLQEIDVVAGLQHPNLLTLIDSGDVDGIPYYIMPFVEGQSLREHLGREPRFTVERAVQIAREVLDGLDYAHRQGQGIFHRDIKPSNILMSGGHAVVADFGIAMALERSRVGRLTATGVSLGSPTYMSPEQATGEGDVDARSDVYSVGCVLYEMLCGGPPIESGSMQRVLSHKILGTYPAARTVNPEIPEALDAALTKALEVRGEDRYPDAASFSEALRAAGMMPPERLSRRVLLGVAATAIALAAFASYWLVQNRSQRALELARDLGELERLAEQGAYGPAFRLGEDLMRRAPGDTTLARLRPMFTDFLPVVTDPPLGLGSCLDPISQEPTPPLARVTPGRISARRPWIASRSRSGGSGSLIR